MQIQNGKLYENRTWLYLYPSLRFYGDDLMDKLSTFFKIATGVGDTNFQKKDNCIFILIDLNLPFSEKSLRKYRTDFSNFLDWVSYKPYYKDNYIFNEEKYQHMIVLKLPTNLKGGYSHFITGEYSKMYTSKQIDYFFDIKEGVDPSIVKRNERIAKARKVFTRSKELLPEFVADVNKKFGTQNPESDFINADLDYPPNKKEEIFNYGTRRET